MNNELKLHHSKEPKEEFVDPCHCSKALARMCAKGLFMYFCFHRFPKASYSIYINIYINIQYSSIHTECNIQIFNILLLLYTTL